MFKMTRKRLGVILPALTMVLLFVLILATMASAGGGVLHRVHAGGPDVCDAFDLGPGCDANLSLVAIQFADGSVKGHLIDRRWKGSGFNAVIDCLLVDGNEAWVSGWITQENVDGVDAVGWPVSARVRDNTADGLLDQISFMHPGEDGGNHPHGTCDEQIDYDLFDAPQGQVIVD